MDRRDWMVAAAAAAAGVPGAMAQQGEARVIGMLSLVGDVLNVVGAESTTGTLLARNQIEPIVMEANDLDRAALRSLISALRQAAPAAKAAPLLVSERRYYRDQKGYLDGDRLVLPPEIAEALKGAKATQLLLLTKHRGDAKLQAAFTQMGEGKLEGLGFYLDRVTPMVQVGSSETAIGFLAPYLYVRLSLVDLASGRVLRSQPIQRSTVLSASRRNTGGDPWEVLDSAAKIGALQQMIEKEVGAALPAVLAS